MSFAPLTFAGASFNSQLNPAFFQPQSHTDLRRKNRGQISSSIREPPVVGIAAAGPASRDTAALRRIWDGDTPSLPPEKGSTIDTFDPRGLWSHSEFGDADYGSFIRAFSRRLLRGTKAARQRPPYHFWDEDEDDDEDEEEADPPSSNFRRR